MDVTSHEHQASRPASLPAGAEQRLQEPAITLPAPPEPFGAYVEAVRTGNLLFLSGMLPTEARGMKFIGRVGAELDVESGRQAARLAGRSSRPHRHLRSERRGTGRVAPERGAWNPHKEG